MKFSIVSALVLGLSSLAAANFTPEIQAAIEARAVEGKANNTGPTTLHLTTSGGAQVAGAAAPTGQAAGAKNGTTVRPQAAPTTSVPMMLGTAVSGKPLTTPAIVKSGVGAPNSATPIETSSALATGAIVGGNVTGAEAAQAASNSTVALKASAGRVSSDASRVLASVAVLGMAAVLFL